MPGVAALCAVAVGLIVLSRPAVGALALVAVVPAVSGLARGFPIPGFRLSEVAIAGLASLILLTADREHRAPWQAFDWLALSYVTGTALLGVLDMLRRGDDFTPINVGTLLGPLQFFLLYRAVRTALPYPEQRRQGLRLLLLASVPISVIALLQQRDVWNTRALLATVTDADFSNYYSFELLNRATGPFPHWHALGGYLFVVILLALGLLLEGTGRVMGRRSLVVVLALALLALMETVTIAPILGVAAGALLLGYWLRRLRRVALFVLASLAVLFLLFAPIFESRYVLQFQPNVAGGGNPFVPETLAYRYDVWTQQYLPALSGRWIAGYGPELPPDIHWRYTESMYITLLLRGGLLLLAVYGGLMLALALAARRLTDDSDPDRRAVARVVFAIVILLVPLHFVMPYFINVGLPHLLWGLAGLLMADVVRRVPDNALSEARLTATRHSRG